MAIGFVGLSVQDGRSSLLSLSWQVQTFEGKVPEATRNGQDGRVEVGLLEACLTELVPFCGNLHPFAWDAHATDRRVTRQTA